MSKKATQRATFGPTAGRADVFFHTAEDMHEIADKTAPCVLGAGTYLGKDVPWDTYATLYRRVYGEESLRIVRPDGVFLVIMTNAYRSGVFFHRCHLFLNLMLDAGWVYIDERVWKRRAADNFQVPFSHVMIFKPPGGTMTRGVLNKRGTKAWFQGVWDFEQSKQVERSTNAYGTRLCETVITACSDPGDLVVDVFAGTGLLLGIAAQMGRAGVGWEIDENMPALMRENGCHVHKDGKIVAPARTLLNG